MLNTQRRRPRRFAATTVVAITCLVATGCSGDGEPDADVRAASASAAPGAPGGSTTTPRPATEHDAPPLTADDPAPPTTPWSPTNEPAPAVVLANPAPGPCPLLTVDELRAAIDSAAAPDAPPGLGLVQPDPTAPGVTELGCDFTAGSATIALWATAITATDTLPELPPPASTSPAASVEGVGDESMLQETIDRSTRRVAEAWVDLGGTRLNVRVIGGPAAVNGRTDDGTVWQEGQAAAITAAVVRQSLPHL